MESEDKARLLRSRIIDYSRSSPTFSKLNAKLRALSSSDFWTPVSFKPFDIRPMYLARESSVPRPPETESPLDFCLAL